MDAGVTLHGADHVIGLIGQGFQRGTNQVCAVEASRQADDGTSGTLVPVGSAKARKGRNHITAVGVGHLRGILRALRRGGDHAQLVAQPLNRRAGDKHRAFQGVFHVILEADRNACHKAVLALDNLSSGIHQQEAARSVGVLHAARFKAALSEEGALLVPGRTGNRDLSAVEFKVRLAVDRAGGLDFGKNAGRDIQDLQQLLIPLELADIEKHGTAGIGVIRHVHPAARQFPDQPGIDRAEEQLSGFRPPSCAGNMVQKPLHLRTGEIRVRNQAGLFADGLPVARSHQLVDGLGGTAALPDDRVGNGLTRFLVPDDCRFALIRDADGGHIRGRCVELVQCGAGDLQRDIPDFIRIMLHPARLRIDLAEFLLHRTADIPVVIKQDAAGTGGSLVQSHDVLHAFRFLSSSMIDLWSLQKTQYIILYRNFRKSQGFAVFPP